MSFGSARRPSRRSTTAPVAFQIRAGCVLRSLGHAGWSRAFPQVRGVVSIAQGPVRGGCRILTLGDVVAGLRRRPDARPERGEPRADRPLAGLVAVVAEQALDGQDADGDLGVDVGGVVAGVVEGRAEELLGELVEAGVPLRWRRRP